MYKDGRDLILGIMKGNEFWPLGHSTGCKISDSTETGERVTKETARGKFKEKYVKSLSESITAEGFAYDGDDAAKKAGLPTLKELWLAGATVKARYMQRDVADDMAANPQQTSLAWKYYEGDYIITSLEDDAPADDDEKYSLTLENTGPVTAVDIAQNASPVTPGHTS